MLKVSCRFPLLDQSAQAIRAKNRRQKQGHDDCYLDASLRHVPGWFFASRFQSAQVDSHYAERHKTKRSGQKQRRLRGVKMKSNQARTVSL
jgi:hypothetical protein